MWNTPKNPVTSVVDDGIDDIASMMFNNLSGNFYITGSRKYANGTYNGIIKQYTINHSCGYEYIGVPGSIYLAACIPPDQSCLYVLSRELSGNELMHYSAIIKYHEGNRISWKTVIGLDFDNLKITDITCNEHGIILVIGNCSKGEETKSVIFAIDSRGNLMAVTDSLVQGYNFLNKIINAYGRTYAVGGAIIDGKEFGLITQIGDVSSESIKTSTAVITDIEVSGFTDVDVSISGSIYAIGTNPSDSSTIIKLDYELNLVGWSTLDIEHTMFNSICCDNYECIYISGGVDKDKAYVPIVIKLDENASIVWEYKPEKIHSFSGTYLGVTWLKTGHIVAVELNTISQQSMSKCYTPFIAVDQSGRLDLGFMDLLRDHTYLTQFQPQQPMPFHGMQHPPMMNPLWATGMQPMQPFPPMYPGPIPQQALQQHWNKPRW